LSNEIVKPFQMKTSKFMTFVTLSISVLLFSCKKEAGEGGTSTITGRVFAKDYNSTFTIFQGAFYAPDLWVYIIYGDQKDYGDRIRTSYDGTYEFRYLRPGTYHIYSYSKDSTLQSNAPLAVMQDVTLTRQYQSITATDIIIFTVNGKN
jgi:hypothetical protein